MAGPRDPSPVPPPLRQRRPFLIYPPRSNHGPQISFHDFMGPRGQWNSPDSPPPTANDSPPPISSDSPVGSSRQVRPIPPLPVFDDPLAPPPAPEILDSPLSPGPAMEESSDDSPDFGLFDRSEEGPYPVEPEETPGFLESPVGSPPSAPRLAFRRLPPGAIGYEGPGPEVGPGLGFGIIESEEEDQFLASPLPRSRSREESGEDDHSDTDDCSTNEDDEEDEGYGDEDEEPLREFGHITGSCGNSGSDSESPEGLLPFGLAEELLGDMLGELKVDEKGKKKVVDTVFKEGVGDMNVVHGNW